MLMMCGLFYMCLSIWGSLQLAVMGLMYKIESTNLIEDVEAEEFENVQDFIQLTRENYKKCAMNCFVASLLYDLILVSTCFCISKAKRDERKREAALMDDNLSCTVEEKEMTEKEKRKIQ